MNAELNALWTRVKQTLSDIERVVDRAENLLKKPKKTGDDGYLDGVALNLHGFYAGMERIFEDIARTMDKSLPSGPVWHRDLLLQMSAESTGVRPRVILVETRDCLDEYRGFRHLVRNIYTFRLKASRLEELAEGVRACFQRVEKDLKTFSGFLLKMNEHG